VMYGEFRIKPKGSFIIESANVSIVELQRKVEITSELNISNNGTGPALRVSQLAPSFADIMLLEADGKDVLSVGNFGNTQINGKLRLGYPVIAPSDNPAGLDPFNTYQLDVCGNVFITQNMSVGQDMSVGNNMSVNGSTYMKGHLTLMDEVTSYSDRRIKKNIHKLENCLDKITTIHGYTFQRMDLDSNKQFIGLMAQEIEGPFPELVTEVDDIKTVNYTAFTSVLLECIQELKEKITLLENKILR
jgi:hypothetical protein